MNFLTRRTAIVLFLLAPWLARAGGGEVVVVYNSELPESRMVAEHYAAARQVPARQIFGLPLSTNEVISRNDFTDSLQQPLAEKLVAGGLWRFGDISFPATTNQPAHVETRVVASKIRYVVLCYGVPLKIAESSIVDELADKLTGSDVRRNEAAVDSELAWLPILKMKVQLNGPLPNPFYGATNRATLAVTNGLLMVARLDGPTAAIANGLVDKALAAESNGFWGRAYFDARSLPTNSAYHLGDQWMMTGAEICRQLGFDVETDTNEATFPASFPMSHIAIYAGWYAGEACGPFAQPKVEFMPGAFAYHLHSFSANTLRSPTQAWCGPLLAKGATCTMGCVYEPYLQFTPNIAFFLQSFGNGYTFGEAAWAAQIALSWQTTVIGDPLYQPFKKTPMELHAQLTRSRSPLLAWSFHRLVNLDRVHGARLPDLEKFLEGIPSTPHSAVLTEQLAGIYAALGKPSSAIDAWQRALTLHPSPPQRLRLRFELADQLIAQDRRADAIANYKQLLAEAPEYPGKSSVEGKLKELEQTSSRTNAPAKM